MNTCLVYRITFPNGKYYIGITSKSLEERKRKHHIRKDSKCTFKLYNALRKYKNLEIWEILKEGLTRESACEFEEVFIQKYDSYHNGYNSTLGGELNLGRKVSEYTKNLLRELNTGSNNPNYGKIKSLESRKNCAASNGTKPFVVYTKDGNLIGTWHIKKQCARDLNLNYQYISNCLKNRYGFKSHKGYIFRYANKGDTSGTKI